MTLPWIAIITVASAAGVGIAFTVRAFMAKEGHDPEATQLLKRFFDGKACAICKRPIPPVQRMGLKPGLLNPGTRETHTWNEIPDANLSALLETRLPLCSECEVAESLRQRFPDRVIDRH